MSLRAQIHDAIDEVAAPAPDLERQVRVFVLSDQETRRHLPVRGRSPWRSALRLPRALVAVALVIALVGGLIIGGRLLRDLHSSPAPAINQGELKRLEARSLLVMPPMPSDGVCPSGPLGTDFIGGPAIGNGVVRSVMGITNVYNGDWGTWNATWFLVNPTKKGLFLVRARDLQTGATVFFAGNISGVSDANIGAAILAGPVAGSERVNGQVVALRPELVMNASAPGDFAKSKKAPAWGAYVGYQHGGSGCIFFQIDYGDQTEKFVRGY